MTTTDTKRIPPSCCDDCGATVDHVEVVVTLAAKGRFGPIGDAEPAEYGDRCPECGAVTSFAEIHDV